MNPIPRQHHDGRCALRPFTAFVLSIVSLLSAFSASPVEAIGITSAWITVQPTEVTGSETFRATIRTEPPSVQGVRVWTSHPELVLLPDPPVWQVDGTLEIELKTAPVSEKTVVFLQPQSGGHVLLGGFLTILPPVFSQASFTDERVPGGDPAPLTLRLSAPAGDTGAIVDLVSDAPTVLPVPARVIIEPGNIEQAVPLFSRPVAFTAPVTVTATHGEATLSASVLVDGLHLIGLTLDRDAAYAGEEVAGTVELGVAAPAPGVTVALLAVLPTHARVAPQVTILPGARTARFSVATLAAAQDVDVTLRATLDGVNVEDTLRVQGATLSELGVAPRGVPGGLAAAGRVAFIGSVPPQGARVQLSSDNPDAASPPAEVLVSPGASSAAFRIETGRVAQRSVTTIRAQHLGQTVSAVIEVLPDAVVEIPQLDLPSFERCMLGPDAGVTLDCASAHDAEGDHDVDLRDFAFLQPVLVGGLVPAPPTFTVDGSVVPQVTPLPSHDGGSPRAVAAVVDANGTQAEFVESELILETDAQEELADFLARWQGRVLFTFTPEDYGLEGIPQHLVRIDTTRADAATLSELVLGLDPNSYGPHRVSSQRGTELLAAAAGEATRGLRIGVNWIARSAGYRDSFTTEHASGPGLTGGLPATPAPALEAYSSSTALWSYLRLGGTQDIGVIEAWRMLDSMGLLQNKVRIGVLDRGFSINADFPTIIDLHSFVPFSSAVNGVGDGDCGAPCPWHATATVCAGMGVADDGFGAAGPAGPVGELVGVRCPGDIATTPAAIAHAMSKGASIINMSFTGSVPASLSWSVAPFDGFTSLMRSSGGLLFAASGNDGFVNVDRESCFVGCWESAWYFPCENAGVTCVGALAHNSRNRAMYSNYGAEDVDIFGPGTVWTSPDPTTTMPQSTSGTSEASPFVAGVAALVRAANPSLTAGQIEDILFRTANTSPDSNVRRYVNAYRAVLEAIGGNEPPRLKVLSPVDGGFYSHGFMSNPPILHAQASDREDGAPTVAWFSSINGPLGTGTFPSEGRELSPGKHVITVTATDKAGLTVRQTLTITMHNPAPRVSIREPRAGIEVTEGNAVIFRADTYDPDGELFRVPEARIVWSSSLSGAMGTGSRLPRVLSRGLHFVTVTATDNAGQSASATVGIFVLAPPVNHNPPPAVSIELVHSVTDFPTGHDGAGRAYTEFDLQARACDPVGASCEEVTNDARFAWYTDRADLQGRFLMGGRSGRVRLYGDRFTVHRITVFVSDNNFGEDGTATVETRIPDFGPR